MDGKVEQATKLAIFVRTYGNAVMMVVGIFMILAAGINEGFFGHKVVEAQTELMIIAGLVIAIAGFVGMQIREYSKDRLEETRIEADADLRKAQVENHVGDGSKTQIGVKRNNDEGSE